MIKKVFISHIRSCLGVHLTERFLAEGWRVAGSSFSDQQHAEFDKKNLASSISLLIHDEDDIEGLKTHIEYFEPHLFIQLERFEFRNQISTELLFKRNLNSSVHYADIFKKSESMRGLISLSSDHVFSYLRSDGEIAEETLPSSVDMYSASLLARESFLAAFAKQFFHFSKWKTHQKAVLILRMPSTQCMECTDSLGGLWSEVQRASRSGGVPQIENVGSFRQWYPVLETAEHIFLLGSRLLSEQDQCLSGVYHLGSLTVPPMTVGQYIQTLNPEWSLDGTDRIVSKHPLLSLEKFRKLLSL